MKLRNFNLFGIYPKPISQWSSPIDYIVSSLITVVLFLALLYFIIMAIQAPLALFLSIGIVSFLFGFTFLIVFLAKLFCK